MDRVVRAFPLLPGKRNDFHAFAEEMRRRAPEAESFYRRFGILRESWHLQETPAGDLVICCTDIGDASIAAPAYAASREGFDSWFKSKVRELSGIDPNVKPLGPACVTAFEWSRT
jgi:hypothetical protein